jgi:NAD-dependent SIR2 family protein deacetylase
LEADQIDMTDLFGNVYVEKCSKCKKLYHRKVIVPNIGRICDDPQCGGRLMKTGTRMNAITPEEPLAIACHHSKKADLAIVLGSSMTISPFCDLPSRAKKMVICTLQETPYDPKAAIKIHSKCDDLMRAVMQELHIQVPSWQYIQVRL